MRGTYKKAALGLTAALLSLSATASDVHDLKKDTFEPFMKDHDLVLAEFFAPWCGHCKALAPEYEEAATSLKEKNIQLAKVDCTEEQDLCSNYGVEGYPTLKVFRGLDNITPYGGQRKAPAIISYMTKQSLPAVSTVTKENLEEFKTADKVVIVAFHEAGDKKSNETFTLVASSHRDSYLFGATSDAELAKQEGVEQPGIVLYKQFDEGKNIYDGKFDADSIEKFAKTAAVPLIGEVGPETYADYITSGLPLAYIFVETPAEREEYSTLLKPIAQKHKSSLNIATIDAKAFGQHGQNLNLEVGKWPAFAIQDTVKNTKYPMAESQGKKLDAKEIEKFVDDFVAGKVEPSIKSEAVPEKQEGPVTVVVAKNYKDVVTDNEKDVLLEFYAPWCGHCKALAPKYEELASLYADHEGKVTVAKIDATANDVPDDISGFPTIKMFPAKDKSNPIEYSGSRTVDDLAQFIRDNGSHKVDVVADVGKNNKAEETKVKETGKETMQHQAPAATEEGKGKVREAAEKVAEKVADAVGGDEEMDDHDEL